jgi:hypothetical protein
VAQFDDKEVRKLNYIFDRVDPDLILDSGGVINWNSSDVTITHSSNALAFAGATSGYTFTGPVIVGVDDTGHDVKFFGATASKYMLWDESADSLIVVGTVDATTFEFDNLSGTGSVSVTNIVDEDNMASDSATLLCTQQSIKKYVDDQIDTADTLAEVLAIGNTSGGTDVVLSTTDEVQFRDAALKIYSSADGQLDIDADTEVEITTTTLDINGAVDISGATQISNTVTVGVDDTGKDVKFFGATADMSLLWDESADSLLIASSAATALSVGLNGATNPAFNVDASTGSSATGINIASAAATAGVALSVLSSGTNENLIVDAKGSGTITLAGTSTGAITFTRATTMSNALTYGGVTLSNAVTGTGNMVLSAGPTFSGSPALSTPTATSLALGGATIGSHNIAVTGTSLFTGAVTVGVDDTGHDVTFFGATSGKSLVWDESADTLTVTGTTTLVGTTNLDATDIDGTVQIDGTVTVGVNGTGKDVKFFGDTSGAYILWDESADKLLTAGGALVDIVKDKLLIGGTAVTTTAAELNILDGVTSTAAELNILDGVTSTAAELNILDGVTSTAAELNILDGVTSTAAELNILDGVTASAADINLIDGITNGTVIASKVLIADSNIDITGGRNITISGELDAATGDFSGAVDIAGTTNLDAVDIDGNVQADGTVTVGVDDTGKDVKFFGATSGKYMLWDESADTLVVAGELGVSGAITINGATGERYLALEPDGKATHFTSSSNAYIFNGQGSSGNYPAGTLNFQSRSSVSRNINFITGSSPAIRLTISDTTASFSGNIDVDGATDLDAVDIDGNVQLDGTLTVGVSTDGYDVKLFGGTSGKYMLWDESADTLVVAGEFSIGGTVNRETTAGTNQLQIFDGTAPVGTLANGCSFYSTSGEMRVMDAAGNATLLSPHDSVTNEWIFDSVQSVTGKRLRIDVEKILRFINDKYGLDAILG